MPSSSYSGCQNEWICLLYIPHAYFAQVESVHLHAKTSSVYKVLKSRGVEQRNAGLKWIREHCKEQHKLLACRRGVLYFMDDDNKYDIRLFEEVCMYVCVMCVLR